MLRSMAEFSQRFAGRYFGKYRGIVTAVDDTKEVCRIRAQVPVVLGDDETGWAWPATGAAGFGNGMMWPPSVGDFVWVEFEEGDPSRAIWTPGPWSFVEGENMTPKHSRGVMDSTDYTMRGYGALPGTAFRGSYGNVRMLKSKSGHFLEFDDTDGAERVQLFHRLGSRIEMLRDGSVQEAVVGHSTRHVGGNRTVEVDGSDSLTVVGNRTVVVQGDTVETYTGEFSQVFQKGISAQWPTKTESVTGAWNLEVGGGYDLQVLGQGSMQFGGQLAMMVGANVEMTALETMELTASNSVGLPTANAVLLHGYNGKVLVRATDPTGLALISAMTLDPTPGVGSIALQVSPVGGAIKVLALPAANVMLGGDGATEPFVCGTKLSTFLSTLLTWLDTHTHPTAAPGAPSVPTVPSSSILASQIATLLSTLIMGK